MNSPKTHGFTLVELVLAMALFITVLVLSTAGFIGLNQTFARGQIRKQLSEASQTVNEDITKMLRAGTVVPTTDTSAGYNRLCFATARYVWPTSGSGLARRPGECKPTEPSSDSNQQVLVRDNFTVQSLAVGKLQDGLYMISGVIRTNDETVFKDITDPAKISCKGSAENSAVRRCAVEKFNFITSARGDTL